MWMPISRDTLMCCVAGDEADAAEKMSEEELKGDIARFLGQFKKHGTPSHVHVSKWRTDPNFCGAYSCLYKNAFSENPVMFHWLTEPVST